MTAPPKGAAVPRSRTLAILASAACETAGRVSNYCEAVRWRAARIERLAGELRTLAEVCPADGPLDAPVIVPAPPGSVCYRQAHADRPGRVAAAYLIEDGPGTPLAMCAPCARADRCAHLAAYSRAELIAWIAGTEYPDRPEVPR